jgi:hypothetical protein
MPGKQVGRSRAVIEADKVLTLRASAGQEIGTVLGQKPWVIRKVYHRGLYRQACTKRLLKLTQFPLIPFAAP